MKPGPAIIFNLAAAIIGSVATSALGGAKSFSSRFLILVVFLVAVLVINYQDRLVLAIKSPGDWKLPASMGSTWGFVRDGDLVRIHDQIRLHQINSLVWGRGRSHSTEGPIEYDFFDYKVRATLNAEGFLEGRWRSVIKGRNYYGYFLLHIERNGKLLVGNWLGVDRSPQDVRCGEWEWRA